MAHFSQALFWDVHRHELDVNTHARFIIERILQFGRPEDLRWLLAVYPEAMLVETIRRSRRLDPKTAQYWAVHFRIPPGDIACFQES